jgi:hypothetical protein
MHLYSPLSLFWKELCKLANMTRRRGFLISGSMMVAALLGCGTTQPQPRPTTADVRNALLVEVLREARYDSRHTQSSSELAQVETATVSESSDMAHVPPGPQPAEAWSSQNEAPDTTPATTVASSIVPIALLADASETDVSGTAMSAASGDSAEQLASEPVPPTQVPSVVSALASESVQEPPGGPETAQSLARMSVPNEERASSVREAGEQSQPAESPKLEALPASKAQEPAGDDVPRAGAPRSDADLSRTDWLPSTYGAGEGFTGIYAGDSGATGFGAGTGYTGVGAGEGFTGIGAGYGYTGAGAGSGYTGIGAADLETEGSSQPNTRNSYPDQAAPAPTASQPLTSWVLPPPWFVYRWYPMVPVR